MISTIIVAMTSDRIIGRQGRLPWHLPDDLKFFQRTTTGHAVIMGRRTFESIGKPLPDRRNIVITRNTEYAPPGGIDVAHSLDAALDRCRKRNESKAFIIGGSQIYRLALPLADEIIVTHVEGENIVGDTYFPEWNQAAWKRMGPADERFPLAIRYRRIRT